MAQNVVTTETKNVVAATTVEKKSGENKDQISVLRAANKKPKSTKKRNLPIKRRVVLKSVLTTINQNLRMINKLRSNHKSLSSKLMLRTLSRQLLTISLLTISVGRKTTMRKSRKLFYWRLISIQQ